MTVGPPERLSSSRLPSPIGAVRLITDEAERLRWLDFEDAAGRMSRPARRLFAQLETRAGQAPDRIARALERYFAGEVLALGDIKWTSAGTVFQRSVWRALVEIPAGETTSYGALARYIGRPAAMRAVGLANGSNPISLVVPCHRVIGSDGSLTGYGGGLERKRWLLRHEGVEV